MARASAAAGSAAKRAYSIKFHPSISCHHALLSTVNPTNPFLVNNRLERFAITYTRKALQIFLPIAFSYAEPVSLQPEEGSVRKILLVGQEAFLVDAWDRIAEHLVAARQTTGRASTMKERAFSTVMDHRPGGSATKASLGGAVLPPLGIGELRPSQNCGCDRGYRNIFHRWIPFVQLTVGCPRHDRTNNRG
jgi:hypothetical protein